jgi:predicted sulfurtransferase
MKGRILISTEGINGTLSCSTKEDLQEYIDSMEKFDLISDLGVPTHSAAAAPKSQNGRLFANIDWKISTTATDKETKEVMIDPFPDLKIRIVKEIVNTGATVHVDDIPSDTGKEISAEEFHNILLEAQQHQDQQQQSGVHPKKQKEIVLIDVRNTFEYAIGHFVHPHPNGGVLDKNVSQSHCGNNDDVVDNKHDVSTYTSINKAEATYTPAINPNTVTFSHFDSTFCSQYSELLKDKQVLMYCTGGIRCVKASAMLKQRGVQDVSHLSGGIHRYLEKYGNDGFYKGRMFVFDQRIALDAKSISLQNGGKEEEEIAALDSKKSNEPQREQKYVVGKCVECNIPFDEISGANLCTVCRDLILICPSCRNNLHEFHCDRHQSWKHCYFTFIERYTPQELQLQQGKLQLLHDSYLPPKEHKNVRRTLRKQMEKIDARLNDVKNGKAFVVHNAKRRCRTCFESDDICDGLCWGYWKHSLENQSGNKNTLEPIIEVKLGDRVTVGPNWNEIRLGSRVSQQDPRLGTVVEIKSWASGADELDCVAVKWDAPDDRRGSSGMAQSEIYRWGAVARNGERMYDVMLHQ